MKVCCVCGYKQTLGDAISFHSFPKEDKLKKAWIESIGKENFCTKKSSVLCSKHFTNDCVYYPIGGCKQRKHLHKNVVPTIFDSSVQSAVYKESEKLFPDITQMRDLESPQPSTSGIDNVRQYTESVQNILFTESTQDKSRIPNENLQQSITEIEPPRTPKMKRIRQFQPRYIGDFKEEDFKSPRTAVRHWKFMVHTLKKKQVKIATLQKKINRQKKKIISLTQLVQELKNKNYITDEAEEVLRSAAFSPVKSLLERCLQSRKRSFPKELKTFATTLHFYSATGYNYVRDVFMKALPHPDTIRRWHQHVNGTPGITREAINIIKNKIDDARSVNKLLFFSLSIDEMSIRRQIDWVGDRYIGFVDLGTNLDSDDLPQAQYALVFMITCINDYFKVPVAYYLIHSLTGHERANLLKQILTVLHEAEIRVISVTIDGAASNISIMNSIGANLCINNLIFYFKHPVTNERIFILLDACHMIKLVRNTLASKRTLYNSDGNMISWSMIEELIKLQETEGLHAATKISRRHINWQKEKMRVSVAVQVLSKSVADALKFCEHDLKLPQFQGATTTAEFCLTFNYIFDLLNSRNQFCKSKSKECIKRENFEQIKAEVEQYIKYIESLKDINGSILQSNRRMGFFGLIVCMKSVLGICECLFQYEQFKFIATYKLSQDHVETFFSIIRRRGGFNNNPSSQQFINTYKRLLVHADIKISKSANQTLLDNTNLVRIEKSDSIMKSDTETDVYESLDDHDYIFHPGLHHSEYVKDIVTYISGFIVRRLQKTVTCSTCLRSLTMDECISSLQKRKNRGGLISASNNVIKISMIAEKVIREFVMTNDKNLLQRLMIQTFMQIPRHIFTELVNHSFEQSALNDHRTQLMKQIIKNYLTVRLYYEGTKRSEAIQRIRSIYTKLVLFNNQ